MNASMIVNAARTAANVAIPVGKGLGKTTIGLALTGLAAIAAGAITQQAAAQAASLMKGPTKMVTDGLSETFAPFTKSIPTEFDDATEVAQETTETPVVGDNIVTLSEVKTA